MWKGDDVKYGSLHDYVKWHKSKPKCCENCGKDRPLDLANISQGYKRDLDDWEWICRGCHMKKDGRSRRFHLNAHTPEALRKAVKTRKERYPNGEIFKRGWETRRGIERNG